MTGSEPRMESPIAGAFAFALRTAAMGAAGGVGLSLAFLLAGRGFSWFVIPGSAAVGLVIGLPVGLVMREGVGGLVAYAIGGGHGHSRSELSHAQALVAKGAYPQAVEEYRAAAADEPGDPRALLLGARVLRDHLHDPHAAAEWLGRAAAIPGISADREAAIVRELVELYEGPLGRPTRALPALARLADRHQGTAIGDWAGERLARLRSHIQGESHAEP